MCEQKRTVALILAAENGVLMKSNRPKALCEVLFTPMVRWVENACRAAGIGEILVVTGQDSGLTKQALTAECRIVMQDVAPASMREHLKAGDDCLVIRGDLPLISHETLRRSYQTHTAQQNAVTVVSVRSDALAALPLPRGTFCWAKAAFLADMRERYEPDTLVKVAKENGLLTGAFFCDNPEELLTADNRKQLQTLNGIVRERILELHLENGVDIPFEEGIVIGPQVTIGRDTRILANSVLLGNTVIGTSCEIGPQSRLEHVVLGDRCQILASYLTDSTVDDGTTIGPFSQLRPNSHVGKEVKIGDFVELKNTTIGDKTSIAHLTYIGDSDVGKLCNFGCGVVTANYDGKKKYRTVVGDRAFIGCNTNLVPPVTVGDGAYTAAGTTITGDIPGGSLAIGRVPATIKEGWADQKISFKKDSD